MSLQFYKATKEGFDGKQVRKPGEVFPFAGKRGSWMVPCDEQGNVKEVVTAQRETRLGTSVSKNLTREELREECRKLGISFKATDSAVALADLLRKFEEEKHKPMEVPPGPSSENPDGGAPGVGSTGGGEGGADAGGTGNQEVI